MGVGADFLDEVLADGQAHDVAVLLTDMPVEARVELVRRVEHGQVVVAENDAAGTVFVWRRS